MHPELKHQLYGGDVSDYYKKPVQKDVKQENKELADIYDTIKKKRFFVKEDADLPPPAIIQKAEDTKLTFDEILSLIKQHEGYRHEMYLDSRGIPTIGIGFNLTRPDAKKILQQVGASHEKILTKQQSLSDDQIQQVFQICINIAYQDAKKWMPSFDSLPKHIKLAILDMSFNLGYPRLSKFIKTKDHIIQGNYRDAAQEIKSSKWATQVGNRAKNIVNLFSS
ncbi:hypothetical protein EBR43_05780 [bacterium]|nr:hypothetical protein [bacterium]